MKEADIFESWADNLIEGTWQLPETPEQQQKLQELMSGQLIVGPDATNATSQLNDLIGDDVLFDRLSDLAARDASANVWDDSEVQARLAELGIQLPAAAEPAADNNDDDDNNNNPAAQQPMNEGRVKELEMDIVDPLMSDSEFETKYEDSRENMARELGMTQDRKTGRFYNPVQEQGVAEGIEDVESMRERIAALQRDLKAVTGSYPGDDRNRDLIRREIFRAKEQLKTARGAKTGMAEGDRRREDDLKSRNIAKKNEGVAEVSLNELAELTRNYYTLSNGKTVQVIYRPNVNQSPIPLTGVKVSYVNPALQPQGGSFDSTGQAQRWDSAPDGVKQAIEKFVKQPGMTETALRDKADLVAKRRALQDLSRNPGVDQRAVQQRQQDLEKEARSQDLAECGMHESQVQESQATDTLLARLKSLAHRR